MGEAGESDSKGVLKCLPSSSSPQLGKVAFMDMATFLVKMGLETGLSGHEFVVAGY